MRGPRPGLLLALSLLTVAAAYSGALDVGFVWDDHTLIEENPAAHDPSPIVAFFGRSFWSHPFSEGTSQGYFRPLTALSFAVDWHHGEGAPVVFHVTNVVAHLLACALLFLIARQLGASAVASMVVTLLFGLFPRLTESVTWVAGRTDVFATVFGLLAVWLELKKRRGVWVALALLLGLLCKEVALAFMVAIVVRRVAAAQAERNAAGSVSLLVAVAVYGVLRVMSGAGQPMRLNDLSACLNQTGALVSLVVVPWFPNLQHGFVGEISALNVLVGAVFFAVAAASFWVFRRSAWLVAGLVTSVLLVTLPNLGLATVTSDRFVYVPLVLLACGLAPMLRGRLAIAVAAVVAVSFTPVTWGQNRLWSHEVQLWQHTVERSSPANTGPWVALGDALARVRRIDEALSVYRQVRETTSGRLREVVDLSIAATLSARGDDAEALESLARLDQSRKRVAFDQALFRARAFDFEGAEAVVTTLEGRFGRDDALTQLELLIHEGKTAWAQSSTPMARAKVADGLGALGHAQRVYEAVLSDSTSTVAMRVTALGWLVLNAPLERADSALAALDADPTVTAETRAGLRALLEERR